MPKLNSIEIKHKRKILNWAGENWSKISEGNKVRIWCALLSKEMPTKVEGTGPDGAIMLQVYMPSNNAYDPIAIATDRIMN